LGLFLFALLTVGEVVVASLLIGLPPRDGALPWQNPVLWANAVATIATTAFLLLVLIGYPRRNEIISLYLATAGARATPYVVANLAFFAALIVAGTSLSQQTAPPLHILLPYACLLIATGCSLAFVVAAPRFWLQLSRLIYVELAVAITAAVIAVLGGQLFQSAWGSLSGATLMLSHGLLSLWEPHVLLNVERQVLGAGTFKVQVLKQCSGLEGITLIIAFLTAYIGVFRRQLRFPHVMLLFPIGIAAMWTLNAVRIAALVSIGAHLSPEVAIQGFHSQAGWICFVLVTLGLIAASQKMAFFTATAAGDTAMAMATPADHSGVRITLAYLAPFMAVMATSIVAGAFAPHDHALYALKVTAVGATLWVFRKTYAPLLSSVSLLSVAAGLAVGAVWIATDPASTPDTATAAWLASLPAGLAIAWLCLRFVGAVALVPVAEELAFRGYLSRALIAARFENVPVGQFSWLGFIGSSLAFGAVHQRWFAAFIAGALYALLMYRTKRLSDPIAAHVVSNALITGWAIGVQQWSLL
jgi:exosortase E/protease (VPEID-CTERM system)